MSGPRQAQRVADAANRMDQRRLIGVELLTQIADVGFEYAGVAAEVVIPDVVEQLRARQDAPRVQHQIAQQAVLGRGQLDWSLAPPHLARVLVELEVRIRQPSRLALR